MEVMYLENWKIKVNGAAILTTAFILDFITTVLLVWVVWLWFLYPIVGAVLGRVDALYIAAGIYTVRNYIQSPYSKALFHINVYIPFSNGIKSNNIDNNLAEVYRRLVWENVFTNIRIIGIAFLLNIIISVAA